MISQMSDMWQEWQLLLIIVHVSIKYLSIEADHMLDAEYISKKDSNESDKAQNENISEILKSRLTNARNKQKCSSQVRANRVATMA